VVGAFSRRFGGVNGIGVPSEKIKGLYSSGTLLATNFTKGDDVMCDVCSAFYVASSK